MVELIVGSKGKGKTKVLLEKAEQAVKQAQGNVVYLDKSQQHMYELSNKIRLINVLDYPVRSKDSFIGFVSGIIASDHDLEYVFFDSFLKIGFMSVIEASEVLKELEQLSIKNNVTFVISLSMEKEDLEESLRDLITVSL